jgi:hypothetical protein
MIPAILPIGYSKLIVFLTTDMASLNYCFSCGEELVEDADFCHGCGQELSKLSDNTTNLSENKAEEDNMYEDIDLLKDDINLDELSLHSSKDEDREELLEMWREAIGNALEEQDVTVEDIDNEDHVQLPDAG